MEHYQLLEQELARWIGCNPEHIVVCSSGTSALHLGLESMRVPVGVKGKYAKNAIPFNVICPNYTMIACPLAISLSGMTSVFVDCDRNLLMQPGYTEKAIDKHTIAIMAVHVYGRLCDMQTLNDIAHKYDLLMIEDMAEAHGCHPHPNTDIACWSFYRNKIVHGEEGGCVYFKSPAMATLARQLRNVGFTEDHDYNHIPRGHNYRMSNLHALPIRQSLSLFQESVERRRVIESDYDTHCPNQWRQSKRESPWVYDIRIPSLYPSLQTIIVKSLQKAGIAARHGFKPMNQQQQFEKCRTVGTMNAYSAAEEVILLPLGPDVSRDQPEKALRIIQSLV